MRDAFSYASILSAVGQVLDEAGIRRFAIEDTGDGLWVEGFDADGEPQLKQRYDVGALYELLREESATSHANLQDEGTLRSFLESHQLVGAR